MPRIIAFSAQQRLPAIYQFREYAVARGLMSCGVSLSEAYPKWVFTRQGPQWHEAGRPPHRAIAQVPVVINLKMAKAPYIAMPSTLLAPADELIE